MTNYIIRKALHEEANEGWVWTRGFHSRSIARISNPASGQSVYCQLRKIDGPFEKRYKGGERIELTDADTLVISEWYRDALGIHKTTCDDNVTNRTELIVTLISLQLRWWASVRAAAHHPDIAVRLGTRLGVLGAWLGLVGIGISIPQMNFSCKWIAVAMVITTLLAISALGIRACWPPTFKNAI